MGTGSNIDHPHASALSLLEPFYRCTVEKKQDNIKIALNREGIIYCFALLFLHLCFDNG